MKYYIIVCFAIILASCHSAKTTQKAEVKTESTFTRFSVSFISVGGGIDKKAKSKFLNFIKEFDSLNQVTINYNISKWGKEGETDYCFTLAELKPEQQAKFINDCIELFKDHKLVRFKENEPCKRSNY